MVHFFRIVDCEPQAGGSAHRVAEHIGLLEPDFVHEGSNVAGEVGIGDRPVDVVGAAVPLELEGVDLVGLGEPGDDLAHGVDVHVRAVQHDQWIAFARDLVVHPHAVHLGIVTHGFGLGKGGGGAGKNARNDDGAKHCRLSSVRDCAVGETTDGCREIRQPLPCDQFRPNSSPDNAQPSASPIKKPVSVRVRGHVMGKVALPMGPVASESTSWSSSSV